MTRVRLAALIVFASLVLAGTFTDVPRADGPRDPSVLAADFHVHAGPGDGLLPVWAIQREAARRGLDVIAITNHNHRLAITIARALRLVGGYPIVIDGQELTTRDFHIAAIGADKVVDPWLGAVDAIAAIQRSGGVAIAAHPGSESWHVTDATALLALDGAEAAHPAMLDDRGAESEMRQFFERTRGVNPDLAPIGSSDFHWGGPVGVCRTYVAVDDPSAEGVLRAIKRGRTVAVCPGGRVTTGTSAPITLDAAQREPSRYFGHGPSTWIAVGALMALGAAVLAR